MAQLLLVTLPTGKDKKKLLIKKVFLTSKLIGHVGEFMIESIMSLMSPLKQTS